MAQLIKRKKKNGKEEVIKTNTPEESKNVRSGLDPDTQQNNLPRNSQTYKIGNTPATKEEYQRAKYDEELFNRSLTNPSNISKVYKEDLKNEELNNVEIPRAENLSEFTSNTFKEASQDLSSNIIGIGKENQGGIPLISPLIQSNLGQAMVGKSALDYLKEDSDFSRQFLELNDYMLKNNLAPEDLSNDPLVQSLLKLKLNENDIKVLKKGKADVSQMGVLIEGLPITSSITKIAGGALTPTTAYKKINDLNQQITKINSEMSQWNEAITQDPKKAFEYEQLINENEQRLLDAQSRIKLLIIQSSVYQNSEEEIENIQINIDTGLTLTSKLKRTAIITKYV